jgi:hypothetical protein
MSRDIWGDNSAPYRGEELPFILASIALICLSQAELSRNEFMPAGSAILKIYVTR